MVGSEGSLLDNKFHSTRLGGLDKNRWSELSMNMLDSGNVSDHPYQKQFENFFQTIDQKKDMPLTSLYDALHAHKVLLEADRSVEQNM